MNKRAEQVLFGDWFQWEGEDIEKGYRRMNMIQALCIYVCK
jgi:hypothetical protein